MILCKSKREFEKLCADLNNSKEKLEKRGVYISSVGRTRSNVKLGISYAPDIDLGSIPEGMYFVWVCGERHPFQSGINMSPEDKRIFDPQAYACSSVFCDNILNLKELLRGIDFSKKGILQENGSFALVELREDDPICGEYVRE
jgi:hypothetical protein